MIGDICNRCEKPIQKLPCGSSQKGQWCIECFMVEQKIKKAIELLEKEGYSIHKKARLSDRPCGQNGTVLDIVPSQY